MRIQLPEQVWLDLSPASYGSRGIAFALDATIKFLIFIAILFILLSWQDLVGFLFSNKSISRDTGLALILLSYFFIDWVYALFFEVICNGVSPGKRLLGLRVVDISGLPITFKRSFLRNLLNPIDIIAVGVIALISMTLSKRSQRLGDLVAGTIVVFDPLTVQTNDLALSEEEKTPISLEIYNAMRELALRYRQIEPNARQRVLQKLYSAFPDEPNPTDPLSWLSHKLATTAPIEEVKGSLDWSEINSQLKSLDKVLGSTNGKKLTINEIHTLAQAYQEVCNLYAYLHSFYPKSVQSKFASQLLRKGRMLVYGRRMDKLKAKPGGFLTRTVRQFRIIKYHVALSALLFIAPAVLAALSIQLNPELGWNFIGEQRAAELREGTIWTDSIQGKSASAAASIMTNNIGVTFKAFAGGITAGVLTAYIMVQNGILLGAIFSLLGFYEMDARLFDFVVAHGCIELSIIVVAGGLGFYLGDAILNPGELSRGRALARNANQIVDLILFNAICLVVAGVVEGFISPYNIGLPIKLGIGLFLGITYWLFLFQTPKESLLNNHDH